MYHATLTPAEAVTGGAIRAMLGTDAARASIDPQLAAALDRTYGRRGWFLFWDEDSAGRPIRGTMSVSFDGEALVVG